MICFVLSVRCKKMWFASVVTCGASFPLQRSRLVLSLSDASNAQREEMGLERRRRRREAPRATKTKLDRWDFNPGEPLYFHFPFLPREKLAKKRSGEEQLGFLLILVLHKFGREKRLSGGLFFT